jgi:nucleotide-binding universal stress UspA family protein
MDLGSATENLLRRAPCNLLLSARGFQPPVEKIADATMAWTDEAEQRMARVPEFARGMARSAILQYAAKHGHTVITSDVIDGALGRMPGGRCPFAGHAAAQTSGPAATGPAIAWDASARARLEQLPAPVREHARLRIEKLARRMQRTAVDDVVMDAASRAVAEMLR